MDAYLSKPVNLDEMSNIIRGIATKKHSKSDVMDIEAALELVGGDEDILKEVIGVFLEYDYPDQFSRLKDGIDRHDAQTVKEAAHSIKGAVSSFGSKVLTGTALELEEMGRNNDLTGAPAALRELEEEVKQFTEVYARYSRAIA